MTSPRLPRFKRSPVVAPLQLTARHHEIIRFVFEHRFLRSSHICSLIGGSFQQTLRQLQLLYHHGYLERPRSQLEYYNKGGSQKIVYGLGNKGATLLKAGLHSDAGSWDEKNGSVKRVFLEHALLVSDIMVSIELACRNAGIRLISERELATQSGSDDRHRPFYWTVKIKGGIKLGVFPDRAFALERKDQNGVIDRIYFFLEADRGTMPVVRKGLDQTSFYRKLLAYEATWSQSLHQKHFGFHRFRVLTVTNSAARVKSLIEACQKLKTGHGLFLFADIGVLEKDILSTVWQTAKQEETSLLS